MRFGVLSIFLNTHNQNVLEFSVVSSFRSFLIVSNMDGYAVPEISFILYIYAQYKLLTHAAAHTHTHCVYTFYNNAFICIEERERVLSICTSIFNVIQRAMLKGYVYKTQKLVRKLLKIY